MTVDELHQMADEELRLGLAEPAAWQQSVKEADGIHALAIQNYWRIRESQIRQRLTGLNEIESTEFIRDLRVRLDTAKRRARRRRAALAWTWIGIFVLSFVGVLLCRQLVYVSYKEHSPWTWGYAVLGLLSIFGLFAAYRKAGRLSQVGRKRR